LGSTFQFPVLLECGNHATHHLTPKNKYIQLRERILCALKFPVVEVMKSSRCCAFIVCLSGCTCSPNLSQNKLTMALRAAVEKEWHLLLTCAIPCWALGAEIRPAPLQAALHIKTTLWLCSHTSKVANFQPSWGKM
jgi:hypothetical protein